MQLSGIIGIYIHVIYIFKWNGGLTRIKEDKKAIILFDGVCHFCNGAVQFIINRDRHAYFQFASLQSNAGRILLVNHPDLESLVLIEDGQYFTESTAVLRIARSLNGLWKIAYIFHVIPKTIRDPLYRYIARHRYRWFGKKQSCMIPSAEIRERFLSVD